MDSRDKRLGPRVAATFKVEYESLDKFLLEYGQDISRGGIFLATEFALPLGTVVRLVLHLPDSDEKVQIVGQVIHRRAADEAGAGGKSAGMGVEFLDIDDLPLRRIRAFVDARLGSGQPPAPAPGTGRFRPAAQRQIDALLAIGDGRVAAAVATALGPDFWVRIAGTGMRALSECVEKPPRLLVVATDLVGITALDLSRAVRQRPAPEGLAVVVLDTGGTGVSQAAGVQAGADDVLAWPLDDDDLRAGIDRLLLRSANPSDGGDRRALRGSIADLGLGSLFALLELERKSGYLLCVREGETGMLGFRQGRVVRAEVRPPGLRGRDKVFYLLDWREGRFEFVSQDVGSEDEIGESVGHLLIQHAQIRDEEAAARRDAMPGSPTADEP